MNKKIIRLTIPNIISNISVPLLSMVDLAIVGHLGSESYISAIAVAGVIFNFIYWNFGFLRLGTGGLTSKAYGAKQFTEIMNTLIRSVFIGLIISILILILQKPIALFSLWIIAPSESTKSLVLSYFYIRIWAAPCNLILYALNGWFIGMQNSKFPMYISIIINILNILFSLLFVYGFKMDVKGVALGTVLAQYGGLILSGFLLIHYYGKLKKFINFKLIFIKSKLVDFFKINLDIFIRSFCLILVFGYFTAFSAKYGDLVLAANTLLLQLFTLFSYIMDGFAYAAESLTGKYIGAKDESALRLCIRYIFRWGWILTILFTVIYFFFGHAILELLTDSLSILEIVQSYYYWVLLVPVCGFAAFLWDGIYVGATASKPMRNAIFIATLFFFGCYGISEKYIGNNALWIAFLGFLLLRGLCMKFLAEKSIFSQVNNP